MNDPHRMYYEMGYAAYKEGKHRRVPYMFKLSYVCGWYDAACDKPSKYAGN